MYAIQHPKLGGVAACHVEGKQAQSPTRGEGVLIVVGFSAIGIHDDNSLAIDWVDLFMADAALCDVSRA